MYIRAVDVCNKIRISLDTIIFTPIRRVESTFNSLCFNFDDFDKITEWRNVFQKSANITAAIFLNYFKVKSR